MAWVGTAAAALVAATPPRVLSRTQARRYDSGTTTFSPEGRLHQVEYAIAAIQNAAAAVGIVARDGIVIVGEKKVRWRARGRTMGARRQRWQRLGTSRRLAARSRRAAQVTSKLLAPPKSSEKMYKIDEHVTAAVAGLTADANILIQYARLCAQQHLYTYDEPQPVQQLVQLVADYKHAYTQKGGLRPFGCSFLFGGWDRHYGFQLYQSDPSGNYSGWKATSIGSGSATAVTALKTEYNEEATLAEATRLAIKVLTKALDTTHPTSERIEVTTLTRDAATGRVVQTPLPAAEVDALLREVAPPAEGGAAAAAGGAGGAGGAAVASM